MLRLSFFLQFALGIWLLSACAPQPDPGLVSSPSTTGMAAPSAISPAVSPSPAGEALALLAARTLDVAVDKIEIVSFAPADFPDSCLGLAGADEMCAQVLTPGIRAVLRIGDEEIAVRADAGYSHLRRELAAIQTPAPPDAAELARANLAARLNQPVSGVEITEVTAVEWGDACLGVVQPNRMCAQVITPGYRILLSAGGQAYVYHANRSGSQMILAEAPEVKPGPALITWAALEPDDLFAVFSRQGVAIGQAEGAQILSPYKDLLRLAQLELWVRTFRSFSAQTATGSIILTGEGVRDPTVSEQRAVAEWAAQVASESQSVEAAGLPVLIWRREGGIAGFCDEFSLQASGLASAFSCRSTTSPGADVQVLSSEELQQLYALLDQFAVVEITSGDLNAADGMFIQLSFAGRGEQKPTLADEQKLLDFAAQIYTRLAASQKETPVTP